MSAFLSVVSHGAEHDGQHERYQNRDQERGKDRTPVAQAVFEFFTQDGQKLFHIPTSSSLDPIRSTNASSRVDCPVTRMISSVVPLATTLPLPITITRSQMAVTSCMMWVENKTHLPCSFRRRTRARRARVLITSSPLLGSSISMFCGPCTRARASATFTRSP